MDLVLQGRGDENVAGEGEKRLVRDRLRAVEADHGPGVVLAGQGGLGGEPVLRVDASLRVADGDDGGTGLREQSGSNRPRIAEALDDDGCVRNLLKAVDHSAAQGCLRGKQQAPGRCLAPPPRPADVDRLAGDDGKVVRALVHHVVGVVHPGHRLCVRVDVGCRDVGVRAEVVPEVGDVAPRDSTELYGGSLLGSAGDSAFGPTERHIDHGGLPGHPRGERAHLVGRHVGVVAEPPFAWAAHLTVKDAVPDEGLDRSVFYPNRKFDGDDAARPDQKLGEAPLQVGKVGEDPLELPLGKMERIGIRGARLGRGGCLSGRGHKRLEGLSANANQRRKRFRGPRNLSVRGRGRNRCSQAAG